MINKDLFHHFKTFLSKIRKHGFTLAEALIITVMTGYCLLPILGTMQNAQNRTQEYDHQSKMQMYTRSRLTEEIANAAFDHTSVNTTDEYHYIIYLASGTKATEGKEKDAILMELPKTTIKPSDLNTLLEKPEAEWSDPAMKLLNIEKAKCKKPYIKIVNLYKTSVETNNTPSLEYNGVSSTETETPKALLGIVVKTCLVQSNDDKYDEKTGKLDSDESVQVPPFTLFSFVNLPVVSDETIWLADALNCKIYGVDPISHGVNTIQLPTKNSGEPSNGGNNDYRPLSIAVHPNLKLLACLTKKCLYLINIDKKGNNYGDYYEYHKFSDEGLHYHDQQAYKFIKFRPDGKYLFLSPIHAKDFTKHAVVTFEITCTFESSPNKLDWEPDNATPKPALRLSNVKGSLVNDKTIVSLLPANDGNLYVAYEDKNLGVIRFPMYCSVIDNNDSEWISESIAFKENGIEGSSDEKIKSIDVSPDGTRLAIVTTENYLYIYDTRNKERITHKNLQEKTESGESIFEPNRVTFSALSYYTQEKIYDDKNLILTVTNSIPGQSSVANVFYYDSSAKDIIRLRATNYSDNKGGNLVINTPDNLSVVLSDKQKSQLYFGTVGKKNSDDVISEANNNYSLITNSSDHASNTVDIATNKRDTLAVSAENKIKLYDLNNQKLIEDIELTAKNTITSLAMNPQGNMLLTAFGSGTGSGDTGFTYFNLNDLKEKTIGEGFGKKIVFDDRTPNMAFSLEYPISTGNNQNSFWNLDTGPDDATDHKWDGADSAYLRRNFKLHSDWERLDLIGMPNGGALALYGKADGSSMLEWIGRRNWKDGPHRGNYKLFARWTNIKTDNYVIPSKTVSTSVTRIDGDAGTIVKVKNPLDINSIINSVDLKTGSTIDDSPVWTTGNRSIIPVLLKKITSPTIHYQIINRAKNPLILEKDKYYSNLEIRWENNFIIDEADTYYIGWWNGGNSSKNGGTIAFETNTSTNTCISDMVYTENDPYCNKHDNIPSYDLYDHPEAYVYAKRDYAIQFKTKEEPQNQFPPLYSKKIAITSDCGTLAILSGVNQVLYTIKENYKFPRINLYDFNNQIYGPETQLEGLLVDYREQRSNHDETDNPVYPFPIETGESLFQKVESSFSINGNTTNLIASFPSLTTKYGPYWSTYKDYPANFYIHDGNKDSYSINHNKRFLGYLRPEKEAKKLQIINTEDVRAFYNNSYLKGSIYVNSNRSFDSTPIINLSAYNSGLLQIDQSAEYLLNMSLAVFLSNVSNPENFIKDGTTSNSKLDDDGYKYVSDKDGWNVLKSEQTYILKNKPSFMGSFIAETTSGDPKQLTINSASMLFSRDRAKPVLYLAGNKYIWTLYKNSLLKNISSENIIKSNLAISEDGQKLLFTKQNDSIASISVYNISNLDETLFIDSTVTSDKILSKQLNAKATTFSTSYLTEMSEMKFNYPNSLTNLATKPFLSYKSSNGGGEYIKLVDDYPFIISNNSAAVASGGIYIIGSDTRKIILFNPTIKRNEAYLLSNHLIKAANSAVIAAYNDTLYTFGNAKVSNEDLGGRVQSFNVNTGEARTSRRESDTYMASRYYDSTSDDYVKISVSSEYSGYSEKENAFKTGTSGDWNTNSQLNGHINYSFEKSSIKQPFVVNKIVIDNSSDYNGNSSRSNATKDYKFVGRNGADEFVLCEGTLEKNKIITINFNNNTAYPEYRFYAINSHATSSSYGVGLRRLTFYRTGLARLTPKEETEIVAKDESAHWMRYKNKNVASATIIWSDNTDTGHFNQIYKNLGSSDNDYYSYQGTYNSSINESWQLNSGSSKYLIVSFSEPEIIKLLRYSCDGSITKIHIFGSNDASFPSVSSVPTDDGWINITTLDSLPDMDQCWIPKEIPNDTKYKHYLITFENTSSFKIYGFELFGEPNNSDSMTQMKTDNLGEVKARNGAACATPYGLVYTGGFDGSNTATQTSILYWPHAINKYDGIFYQYGIPRSLPEMKIARANHALVWHKGKIYAIGGRADSGEDNIHDSTDFIEVLDYNNKMEWELYTKPFIFVDDASDNLKRYNLGACSFGDEIFIFGGCSKDNVRTSAIALNPDTGVIRKITDMYYGLGTDVEINPCVAVPFGSKIYIMGNDTDSPYSLKILEYTP